MHHSYIIRVYRHEKNNPRMLVGLVEEVGTAGKMAFNNLEDLWEILNRATGSETQNKNPRSNISHDRTRRNL